MRTIEEIKDQVAKDNGWKSWRSLIVNEGMLTVDKLSNEVIKEAQKEVVKKVEIWEDDLSDTRKLNLLLDNLLTEIENQ